MYKYEFKGKTCRVSCGYCVPWDFENVPGFPKFIVMVFEGLHCIYTQTVIRLKKGYILSTEIIYERIFNK